MHQLVGNIGLRIATGGGGLQGCCGLQRWHNFAIGPTGGDCHKPRAFGLLLTVTNHAIISSRANPQIEKLQC